MKLLLNDSELSTYKSREPIPLECENCGITFYKNKNIVQTALKGNPQFALRFCSLKCHHINRVKTTHTEVSCAQCGKKVVKQISWIKNNEYNFCSKSCSATFQNANARLGKSRKSKAESYLAELICANFANLEIDQNTRDVLPSRLEIDIYIPSLRVAFELNGPVHYFPLYGQRKLDLIRQKDHKKQIEAQVTGIRLYSIDISNIKYWKETRAFLDSEYINTIKPTIERILSQSRR